MAVRWTSSLPSGRGFGQTAHHQWVFIAHISGCNMGGLSAVVANDGMDMLPQEVDRMIIGPMI